MIVSHSEKTLSARYISHGPSAAFQSFAFFPLGYTRFLLMETLSDSLSYPQVLLARRSTGDTFPRLLGFGTIHAGLGLLPDLGLAASSV